MAGRPKILSLPIGEPGESEYSHGKGLSAPEERGHVTPLSVQHGSVLRHRMDPADPTASPDFNPSFVDARGETKDSTGLVTGTQGTEYQQPTPRLREKGPSKGGNNNRSYPEGAQGTDGG